MSTTDANDTPPTKTMSEQFDAVIDKLSDSIANMKTLVNEVKALKKESARMEKAASSKKKVKKERDPNKPPPFTKPVEISDELRAFLGQDGEISRTEVTQKMYAYIKDKALQNQEQKRQFILDAPLAELFKLKKGDSMEYFKLQTHMKHHYPAKT
jgi:upstream activation factor subunit UAF30